MANSIVGISILTMPLVSLLDIFKIFYFLFIYFESYCFDQCGIFLGSFALAMSGLMTSYSCKLLLKTAEVKNSRNLEFLAFKIYGHWGKLLIEIWFVLRFDV
jgi:hypothetical protein